MTMPAEVLGLRLALQEGIELRRIQQELIAVDEVAELRYQPTHCLLTAGVGENSIRSRVLSSLAREYERTAAEQHPDPLYPLNLGCGFSYLLRGLKCFERLRRIGCPIRSEPRYAKHIYLLLVLPLHPPLPRWDQSTRAAAEQAQQCVGSCPLVLC